MQDPLGGLIAKFNINNVSSAVLIGGGHGIGLALVKKLIERNKDIKIFVSYRKKEKADSLFQLEKEYYRNIYPYKIDPTNEEDVHLFADYVGKAVGDVDILINAVGFLHQEDIKPEKSLKDIRITNLQTYFLVNSIVSPLLAKHFSPLFCHEKPSCFAAISAKVGSIDDNKMGGWYGYRASKAALNMFIKNISLEFKNHHCNTFVTALHPGTTISELSKPYTKKTNLKLHSAEDTASNLLSVIDGKSLSDSGSFYSWDGEKIPW